MNDHGLPLIVFLGWLGIIQAAWAEPAILIDSAWIREAPPASPVLAAYMTLHNVGDSDQQISGLESPDFRAAEIHRTVVEDGVAKMLPAAGLEIAAGNSITLEPGGLHVMLFEPLRPMREGDLATLIVHMADGTVVTVQARVRRMTDGDESPHDHSHHHH